MEITKRILKNKELRLGLYKIINKLGKEISYKRNKPQQHFHENKHTRNLILKSRQLGFTTDECISSFDDTLWKENFNCLIIAHTKDDALDIFDNKIDSVWEKYKRDYPQLADLYTLDADRANKIKFDFGGGKFSTIQVKSSARSGTYQRVHITEFAKLCKKYPQRAKEIITGTIPAVPESGRIDIESTAEGEEGYFYDMFWEAWERGEPQIDTQFKAHFYNWQWEIKEIEKTKVIPIKDMDESVKFGEYQIKHSLTDKEISFYYKKYLSLKTSKGGSIWNNLRQEYPTTPQEAFVSSGNKMFDYEILQKYETVDGRKVGEWIYYTEFKPSHAYGIGVDVAEGVGQDSSAIVIVDFTAKLPEIVAIYKSNEIEPDQLAFEIRNGGEKYGNAIVAVERNNHGHATLVTLKGIYTNIYTEIKVDSLNDKRTEKLGWLTTRASKPRMLSELKTDVEDELFVINSKEIIREMQTYDRENLNETKFDESQTRHWDLLIAFAICYQMRTFAEPAQQDEQDGHTF